MLTRKINPDIPSPPEARGLGCWRWSVRAGVALVENRGRRETRLSSFLHSKRDDQSTK